MVPGDGQGFAEGCTTPEHRMALASEALRWKRTWRVGVGSEAMLLAGGLR